MQLDPMKPTLKEPGSKRSKLKYDALLSSFTYKFKLRRYDAVLAAICRHHGRAHGIQRTGGPGAS